MRSYAALFFVTSFMTCLAEATLSVPATPSSAAPVPYDADLFSKDREMWFLDTEFLYYNVMEGDLQYVSRMTSPTSSPSLATGPIGNYKKSGLDWRPGFRTSFGYYNAPKFWEVMAVYTWFYSEGSKSQNKPEAANQFLRPLDVNGLTFNDSNPLIRSSSDINFHYNVVDTMVDRLWIPNNHLRMKVLGGLTAGWMSQNFNIYNTQGGTNQTSRNSYHWGYWGAGFRLGLDLDWYWGNNIYFTGKTSAALLLGKYHNSSKAVYQTPGSSEYDAVYTNATYTDYRGAYNFQFILGPSWQMSYPKHRFEVFLGYEINTWFNLAEIWRYAATNDYSAVSRDVNDSPLTLNGVNLRLTVDF